MKLGTVASALAVIALLVATTMPAVAQPRHPSGTA
jgi:hypothetical protein